MRPKGFPAATNPRGYLIIEPHCYPMPPKAGWWMGGFCARMGVACSAFAYLIRSLA